MNAKLKYMLLALALIVLIAALLFAYLFKYERPPQHDIWVIGGSSAPYVSGYRAPPNYISASDRWHRAFDKLYADYKILEESKNKPEREWQSVDEFLRMFKGSITAFQDKACLPIVEQIQEVASQQGYTVQIAFALDHLYYGKVVTKVGEGHAGLVIKVKDAWYFIDPNDWGVTKLW